jgi:phenylpyruvate tautomerase PptA (4-oxalocrotonate tautomerase family)
MPVIQIQALPQPADRDIPAMLMRLCRVVADAVDLPPDYVSATWQTIAPGRYVVGGEAVMTQPRTSHPVIVDLAAFEMNDRDKIRDLLRVVGRFLEDALGLPGNVFILFRNTRAGEVYDGGEVVGI